MRALLILSAVTLCACNPAGSFNGTVAGQGLAVKDSIFFVATDGAGKQTGVVLALTDQAGACDLVKANRNPKNSTVTSFILARINGDHSVAAPDVGDYSVTTNILMTGNLAFANYAKNDTNCTNTVAAKNATGQSGLLKVVSFKGAPGGTMSGNFDVTWGEQADKVSGSFNATFCDAQLTSTAHCE